MPWVSASHLDNAAQDLHDTAGVRSLYETVMSLGIPEWHSDALCREYEPTWFFPTRGGSHLVDALDVCSRCLVAAECRAAALADPSSEGIWGGTTTRTRAAMRRNAAA